MRKHFRIIIHHHSHIHLHVLQINSSLTHNKIIQNDDNNKFKLTIISNDVYSTMYLYSFKQNMIVIEVLFHKTVPKKKPKGYFKRVS